MTTTGQPFTERGDTRFAPTVLLVLVALFFSPLPQFGQLVQQEPQWFRISGLSGALTFRFQLTDEEEMAGHQVNRDANRRFLEGGLQLAATGSIYHPNLLSFSASANLVAHRSKNRIFSDPTINKALNNTYNIHLFLLKKKKINLDLFTISNYSTADRAFLERYFTTYTTTGLNLRSLTKWLPSELEVFSNHIKSESLSYKERNEKTSNLKLRTDLLKLPRTSSIFHARYKDYAEAIYDVEYRSWDLSASFNHRYGVKDRSSVTSLATYHSMTGYFDINTFHFRLSHLNYFRPKLFLNNTYNFNSDNSRQRTFSRHDASVGLNHQLFESLTSRISVGGRFEMSNSQRNSAFRYGTSFRYRKKIPGGSISLDYLNRNEHAKYISREEIVTNSDIYDFSLNDAIILALPGISVDTIQVMAEDLSFIYIRDVDYMVDRIDDLVTITRLPGGAIPYNGNVLIRYQYLAYPDYRLKTHNYMIRSRLNVLRYFFIFYAKSANHQNISSIYLIPPFENYDKQEMGARIQSKLLNASYTYETYDSSISDYISHNLRIAGNVNLFRKLRLAANFNINRLTYEPETFFSRFTAYSLESRYNLKANITAKVLYRDIKYSTPSYRRSRKSLLFKFQWDFRMIMLHIFYERILTGSQITERDHDFFSIMLRRVF